MVLKLVAVLAHGEQTKYSTHSYADLYLVLVF